MFTLVIVAMLADPKVVITERIPAPVTPQVSPVNPWLPTVPEAPKATRRIYVFGYEACDPCRASRPNLDSWVKTAGLPVTKPTPQSECVYIDIQTWPHLAGLWNTDSYPTVIVHDDLKEVARHEGAYSVADLERLWNTGRPAAAEAPLVAAFAAGAGSEIVLPKMSINPDTKAVTILETVEIPYGNYVIAKLTKGCVVTMGADGTYNFSTPLPQVRTRPIRLDLNVQAVKLDMVARTAVLQIDGWRPQTIKF